MDTKRIGKIFCTLGACAILSYAFWPQADARSAKDDRKAGSSTTFEDLWKLENQAMARMFEVSSLREQLREAIVNHVLSPKKTDKQQSEEQETDEGKPEPFKPVIIDGLSPKAATGETPFKWLPSGTSLSPISTIKPKKFTGINELKLKLGSQEVVLKQIEDQLDSEYSTHFTTRRRGRITLRGKLASDPAETAELMRIVALNFQTNLRRGIGMHFWSDLFPPWDPDCQLDLVSGQPLLKHSLALINGSYSLAFEQLYRFAQLCTSCWSSQRLATADFHIYNAAQKTLSYLDPDQQAKALEMLANVLLNLYNTGKAQYSIIFELWNEYEELIKKADYKGSLIHTFGVHLVRPSTNEFVPINFEEPEAGAPGSKGTVATAGWTQESFEFEAGVTTPYGLKIKELQEKWCAAIQAKMMQKQLAEYEQPLDLTSPSGASMEAGPSYDTTTWSGATEAAADPEFVGTGASSFSETFELSMPDPVGICGGLESKGGGGAGVTCSMSKTSVDQKVLKACYSNVNPYIEKGPKPVDTGDVGVQPQQFTFKSAFLCPGGQVGGEGAGDADTGDTTVDDNISKGIDQANKDGKKVAEAAGETDKKKVGKAYNKASNDAANAKVAKGLKVTVEKGHQVVWDDKGKVYGSGPSKLPDGTYPLGGATIKEPGKEPTIVYDEGAVKNGTTAPDGTKYTGPEVVAHEIHENALVRLGKTEKTHDAIHKGGAKYCAVYSGGACSPVCNAGEVMVGLYYNCPEQEWTKPSVPVDECEGPGCPDPPYLEGVVSEKGPPNPPWPGFGLPDSDDGPTDQCFVMMPGPDGFPPGCTPFGGGGNPCKVGSGGPPIDFAKFPGFGITDPSPLKMIGGIEKIGTPTLMKGGGIEKIKGYPSWLTGEPANP